MQRTKKNLTKFYIIGKYYFFVTYTDSASPLEPPASDPETLDSVTTWENEKCKLSEVGVRAGAKGLV